MSDVPALSFLEFLSFRGACFRGSRRCSMRHIDVSRSPHPRCFVLSGWMANTVRAVEHAAQAKVTRSALHTAHHCCGFSLATRSSLESFSFFKLFEAARQMCV